MASVVVEFRMEISRQTHISDEHNKRVHENTYFKTIKNTRLKVVTQVSVMEKVKLTIS